MKTFGQFNEDASAKFKAMSDDQFADWKKSNPGGAAKADALRGKSSTTSTSTAAADRGGQLVRQKQQRQSQMGKWSQSVQKTPPQGKPAPGNKPGARLSDLAKKAGRGVASGARYAKNKVGRAIDIVKGEAGRSVKDIGVEYGSDLMGAS